jgi:hypothetical protein
VLASARVEAERKPADSMTVKPPIKARLMASRKQPDDAAHKRDDIVRRKTVRSVAGSDLVRGRRAAGRLLSEVSPRSRAVIEETSVRYGKVLKRLADK